MDNTMNTSLLSSSVWKQFYERERGRFFLVLAAVFAWGLLAHAYGFLNLTISHDSLNEFYVFGDLNYEDLTVAQWKIALGRFLNPLYRLVFDGASVTPWLNGVLALFWLALSVWVICLIFDIRSKLFIVLLAGICTVNETVIAITATYINDLGSDTLAILLACLAAYCWQKGKKYFLRGGLFAFLSMALYQAMISVTIVLCMFVCLLRLLDGKKCLTVVIDGLKAIALIAAAGVIYLLAAELVCSLFGITVSDSYNGLTNIYSRTASLVACLLNVYKSFFRDILTSPVVWPLGLTLALHLLLAATALYSALCSTAGKKIKPLGWALIVLLVMLLPLGAGIAGILSGMFHTLMAYAFWLVYLLVLLLVRQYTEHRSNCQSAGIIPWIAAIAVALILWANVQAANQAYVKKDLARQTTLSVMTEVVNAVEQTDGYISGETEVAFIGLPATQASSAYNDNVLLNTTESSLDLLTRWQTVSDILSLGSEVDLGAEYYSAYLEYVLQSPMRVCSYTDTEEIRQSEAFEALPCFPAEGSIAWIDDVLVVKLSE